MKRIFKNICIASAFILLVGACKEDTLLFPPAVEDTGADGIIDVVSKPSDVVVLGEYDYNFRIKWPKFSDKVSKIVAKYTDEGVVKTAEFTNFGEDGLIETSAYGEYTFELTTYGSQGQVSNPIEITATNKGFIIEEVIATPLINLLEGEVEVSFVNSNLVPITITATYPGASGDLTKTVTSSEDVIVISFPAQDGTHDYTIELEDAQGRKVSASYGYEFEYIITSSFYAQYGMGKIGFANNANSNITLKVTYPVAGGGTNVVEESFDAADVVFNFLPIDGTHEVKVEYIDEGGRSSEKTFSYTHYPYVFKAFTTTALKASWSVAVSSNAQLVSGGNYDGSGGNALIDGNPSTYWHTPYYVHDDYAPVLAWPHYATITFDKEIQLTKLIMLNRHNNGNGAPKDIDLQVSTNGVDFVTHQSFVNSNRAAGATMAYDIAEPVATKFVRVLFRTPTGDGSNNMALGEISFEGNQNL